MRKREEIKGALRKALEGHESLGHYVGMVEYAFDVGSLTELTDKLIGLLDQVPDGVEWPRFEDGELVRPGDMVVLRNGKVEKVCQIHFGGHDFSLYTETEDEYHEYGDLIKRPEPEDTQERIDEDARKGAIAYWGCDSLICDECPAAIDGKKPWERYDVGACDKAQTLDLLRRQRELDERSGSLD